MFDHFTPPPAVPAGPLATLLDVTLRDGGFEVDFDWPATQFAAVTAAVQPMGVQIVELGYLGGVPLEHSVTAPGVGARLTPDLVASARRDGVRLAAMIHPSALTAPPDMAAFAAAGLDMARFVYHPDWCDPMAALAAEARNAGLSVTVNVALASRYTLDDLREHAARIRDVIAPDVLYVADTCGALLPADVGRLVACLTEITPAVGFHAHDFLGLAYANTLTAVSAGATYTDISILGLGRGGGNLLAETVLVRHRLPQLSARPADLRTFLECRAELAGLAARPLPALLPVVCGARNLTPVEEYELVAFAAGEHLDLDLAALWSTTATQAGTSRYRSDLAAAWQVAGHTTAVRS